jgi:uncharacterized membrane protein
VIAARHPNFKEIDMSKQHVLIQSAVAGLLALGIAAASGSALAADQAKEKCFGVAKAGQNDCGSNKSKHACAGQSKIDNDPADFKYVPAGTCAQMGGSPTPHAAMEMKK